jgi:hypothetical protein
MSRNLSQAPVAMNPTTVTPSRGHSALNEASLLAAQQGPSPMPNAALARLAQPWWQERMMWLVVGGPAVVVVASFVTLALAIARPDPVMQTPRPVSAEDEAPGTQGERPIGQMNVGGASLEPAVRARNHAATGGVSHERK